MNWLATTLPMVMLERNSRRPLYRQLYDALREAILTGQLESGTRVPSTRALADELSVSRITVASAFEQLAAEGYLEARVGDGTFVARTLPDELLQTPSLTTQTLQTAANLRPSQRGTALAATQVSTVPRLTGTRAFQIDVPALEPSLFTSGAALSRACGNRSHANYWLMVTQPGTIPYARRLPRTCVPFERCVASSSKSLLRLAHSKRSTSRPECCSILGTPPGLKSPPAWLSAPPCSRLARS